MFSFPKDDLLFTCLKGLFSSEGELLAIQKRNSYVETSTYPIELVQCLMGDSREIVVFCKYLAAGGFSDFGHRGGLIYEARVYETVLKHFPYSKVKYYGIGEMEEYSETVMVLDYLGEYLRFVKSEDPVGSLELAAGWIGRFHRFANSLRPDFLNQYHWKYYHHWLEHFSGICAPLISNYPFLTQMIETYRDNLQILLEGPQTIIHGEYYPRNVLLKDGAIYPVDWESAAIGPGEVDLATLIEDWDEAATRRAKKAYVESRWPDGVFSSVEFERRLVMSKLYLFARFCPWVKSSRTDWIKNKSIYNYLLQIISEAQQVLCIPAR